MKNIEEKLFDYIEGTLAASEKEELERLIARDPALKNEIEAIQKADSLMLENNLLSTINEGFSDRVLSRISGKKRRFNTSNRILWLALSLFALIMAAVVMVLPAMQSAGPGYIVPEEWIPQFPAVDGGKFMEIFSNPALLQLALAISAIALLLVLDKLLSNKLKIAFKE